VAAEVVSTIANDLGYVCRSFFLFLFFSSTSGTVTGIVYMHRISDNRCVGSPQKNMILFDTLCGGDARKNIVIATTMWKQVRRDIATQREDELGKKRWREMLQNGSRIMRFHDTFKSAWDIIDNVVRFRNTSIGSVPPRIDIDLVQPPLEFNEIEAGIDQLRKLKASYVFSFVY
jgi:hypothetical protein